MFEHIYSDIQNEADWVLTFKAEFSDKARQDRKALEQAWADARKEMFTALSEYPRNVSEVAFSNRFDKRFGHPSGRTREFIEPTPAITDDTLQADIRHFKAATADIHADTEWMQAMPAADTAHCCAHGSAYHGTPYQGGRWQPRTPVSLNSMQRPPRSGYLPNSRRNSSNSPTSSSTRISIKKGNLKTHSGFPL